MTAPKQRVKGSKVDPAEAQGDKLLSAALHHIQIEHQKRDSERLAKGGLTKRDKRLLAQKLGLQNPDITDTAAE